MKLLSLLEIAIKKTGYKNKISIAIDAAASTFHNNKQYILENNNLTAQELTQYYEHLINRYNISSIEDPADEEDIEGWQYITQKLGHKIKIVGDDLFVTNKERIIEGNRLNIANTVLIKPNQIGTLSETMEAISIAKNNGYSIVISHRSGETEDTTISHIAIAAYADYIKTGVPL